MPVTSESTQAPSGLRTPLRVQNQEGNRTVFAKVIDGNSIRIVFEPRGHQGDTQRVPVSVAEDIDFINSLEVGVLKVVGGPPEVVEALQFETEQVRQEREQQATQSMDVIDRRQDKDIVGVQCIGPAPEGRSGECGRSLIQSAKQSAETPPLCNAHAHLAPKFYLVQAGSKGEGATETRDGVVRREWRQVSLTERRVEPK